MNPDTGNFHEIQELESLIKQGLDASAWPRFAAGEQIIVKDHKFKLVGFDLEKHTITLQSWELGK